MAPGGVRRATWVALALGLAVMAGASVWAPAQPEMFTNGGACEIDLCGFLEDPPRWRAAWVPWRIGAFATLAATVVLARPVPGTARLRAVLVVLVVVAFPFIVVVGYVVSTYTSVHGFATVMWTATLLPLVALVVMTLRGLYARVVARRGMAEQRAG